MINLTYSEIAYLFADTIVPDRAKLLNYDAHPSGQKIPFTKLAQKMVIAAVIFLSEKGFVQLNVQNIKRLFIIPSRDVFIKKTKDSDNTISGIETTLLNTLDSRETPLSKAIYHLLSEDESSPWGQIVLFSKKSLVEKKVLYIEERAQSIFSTKRYLFSKDGIDQFLPQLTTVKKAIDSLSEQEELSRLITSAVKSGMDARKEQSTSDD